MTERLEISSVFRNIVNNRALLFHRVIIRHPFNIKMAPTKELFLLISAVFV